MGMQLSEQMLLKKGTLHVSVFIEITDNASLISPFVFTFVLATLGTFDVVQCEHFYPNVPSCEAAHADV